MTKMSKLLKDPKYSNLKIVWFTSEILCIKNMSTSQYKIFKNETLIKQKRYRLRRIK